MVLDPDLDEEKLDKLRRGARDPGSARRLKAGGMPVKRAVSPSLLGLAATGQLALRLVSVERPLQLLLLLLPMSLPKKKPSPRLTTTRRTDRE